MTIPTGRKIGRTLFHAQRPENWIGGTRAENREWPRQTTHEPRNQARTRNQAAPNGASWGLRSRAPGASLSLPQGPLPRSGGFPRPWTSPPPWGLPPALGLSPGSGAVPRLWGPPPPRAPRGLSPLLHPSPTHTAPRPPHDAFICNEFPDPLSFRGQHETAGPAGTVPPEGFRSPQ